MPTSELILVADVDECSAATHNCHGNAACNNTVGSYSCSCNTGYSGDGITCSGIFYSFLELTKFKHMQSRFCLILLQM